MSFTITFCITHCHKEKKKTYVSLIKVIWIILKKTLESRQVTEQYILPYCIHVPKAERRKLDSKSIICFFVGYCTTQKAYRFWDPLTRKIRISRDVVFNEQIHDTPREGSVQSDMDETVKQLLSDLMINSHIPVTPISVKPKSASKPNQRQTNQRYKPTCWRTYKFLLINTEA